VSNLTLELIQTSLLPSRIEAFELSFFAQPNMWVQVDDGSTMDKRCIDNLVDNDGYMVDK